MTLTIKIQIKNHLKYYAYSKPLQIINLIILTICAKIF